MILSIVLWLQSLSEQFYDISLTKVFFFPLSGTFKGPTPVPPVSFLQWCTASQFTLLHSWTIICLSRDAWPLIKSRPRDWGRKILADIELFCLEPRTRPLRGGTGGEIWTGLAVQRGQDQREDTSARLMTERRLTQVIKMDLNSVMVQNVPKLQCWSRVLLLDFRFCSVLFYFIYLYGFLIRFCVDAAQHRAFSAGSAPDSIMMLSSLSYHQSDITEIALFMHFRQFIHNLTLNYTAGHVSGFVTSPFPRIFR